MLIELADGAAHEEDSWVGGRIAVGETVLQISAPVPRCAITTQDPDTGERDLDTLRTIIAYRGLTNDHDIDFGVYGEVERPGRIRLGDSVEVLRGGSASGGGLTAPGGNVMADTGTTADLRRRRPPDAAIDWARRTFGDRAEVRSVEALEGGVSHANHALEIRESDQTVTRVVLRRWVRTDWRETDPDFSPEQEIATYALLSSSTVPAPRLLGADPEGRECDVPAILMTWMPGRRIPGATRSGRVP